MGLLQAIDSVESNDMCGSETDHMMHTDERFVECAG